MPTSSHWLLPEDATKTERDIFMLSVENIYNKFDDPLDKLIIALAFELDYPQKAVGRLIGREEVAISLRIKKIRTVLSGFYRANLKP